MVSVCVELAVCVCVTGSLSVRSQIQAPEVIRQINEALGSSSKRLEQLQGHNIQEPCVYECVAISVCV